jgi:hypothetical protein
MDLDLLRIAVDDTLDGMLATDPIEHRFNRSFGWPKGSCEDASAVLSVILEERGLGRWTFVTACRPDDAADRHAWLELREHGVVLFSIDPTIQQFRDLASKPFIGAGRTPAAARYSVIRSAGYLSEWEDFGHPDMPLQRLIAAVQQHLRSL